MSGKSKKQEKDDEYLAGIGHNQGPAIDQEPVSESDKLNLVNGVNATGGDQHHSVEADDYSANSSDSLSGGRGGIDGFEDRRASGFKKVDGRHVAADGLVSRRGLRRIIPGATREEQEWIEEHTWQLRELAKDMFHGRTPLFLSDVFSTRLMATPSPPRRSLLRNSMLQKSESITLRKIAL
jgi:hypothetical protein